MVQVSYPGVYIQEVPSGSRTITGVATSVTAFVGMAKRGPMDTPTTILGFTDYTRIFGDDISQGEMTDQVRQFFLNGGTTAIIMRIAQDDAQASVTIPSGTQSVVLTSRGSGFEENLLRAAVDFNTAEPEKTFNLTIFREVFDASGNSSVGELEVMPNLSLDDFSSRFAETIFERDSVLATADVTGTSVGAAEFSTSISAKIVPDYVTALNAATGRNLRVTLSNATGSETKIVTLTTPITLASIGGDISAAFTGAPTVVATVLAVDTDELLRITVTGRDIAISSAPNGDIAAFFGLGTDNGGIEVGRSAFRRARPNGLTSRMHGSETVNSATAYDLARLINFATTEKSVFAAAITLSDGAELVPAGGVAFPVPTASTDMTIGTTPDRSLLNVRENLNAIANAINSNRESTNWRATVQGYRMVLTPLFGTATAVPGQSFTSPSALATGTASGIFEAATAGARAFQFTGGDDGTPPSETDYTDAYAVIDAKVDLFNLLILPKSAQDPDRRALWGPASSFALSRRAFLLIDAEDTVTTVDQAVQAVKDLRIGIVKDHAALYWPRIEVNPDGNRRKIDPSGSVAGVMSRIDSNRGVWKAPAGLEADIRGALAVTTPMSDPENGRLNPQALNAIRIFPNGIIVWGSRTMDGFDNSGNDDFKYVPVRRFTLFIEESLYRGLKFAVFEPNAEPLWSAIRTAVGAFMNNLFRQGAFAGKTTREAYFVKVDSETTTQNDINLGIVNVVVGFAPLKPAEFVVVTIKQQAGQVQV